MNKRFLRAIAITFIGCSLTVKGNAQLNVQLHRDFGHALYGADLKTRPNLTATIENFKADKWGSTYFFVDADFADNQLKSSYGEISRELRFWKAPIAFHVEYNGGLSGSHGSYNDAYLTGLAYNWNSKDFRRGFSLQTMYKYLAHASQRHSWQITTVWHIIFAHDLCTITGYTDLWHDNTVNGDLIFQSEPQFWFNLAPLSSVSDDFHLSVGGEVELSNNFIFPEVASKKNNRFYAIPTLAVKWTF
jgi:hypothetical protein